MSNYKKCRICGESNNSAFVQCWKCQDGLSVTAVDAATAPFGPQVHRNPALAQLTHELQAAVSGLTPAEWRSLLLECIKYAGAYTWKTKKKAVKDTGAWLLRSFIRIADEYTRDPKRALQKDAEKVRETVVAIPGAVKKQADYFLSLSKEEQIECAIAATLAILVFFATAGGMDLEGGLCDLDLKFGGPGNHRHWTTHSVVLGMGVEFGMYFALNFTQRIHARLPASHHEIWDVIIDKANKAGSIAISAMWIGIGAHLLKDAGIFSGRIKPIVGLPCELPMWAHKGFIAANSALAGTFGINPLLKDNDASEPNSVASKPA